MHQTDARRVLHEVTAAGPEELRDPDKRQSRKRVEQRQLGRDENASRIKTRESLHVQNAYAVRVKLRCAVYDVRAALMLRLSNRHASAGGEAQQEMHSGKVSVT
jgi:hypothetical protein